MCQFPLGSTLNFSFGPNPRASRRCDSWIRLPVEVGKYDHSEQPLLIRAKNHLSVLGVAAFGVASRKGNNATRHLAQQSAGRTGTSKGPDKHRRSLRESISTMDWDVIMEHWIPKPRNCPYAVEDLRFVDLQSSLKIAKQHEKEQLPLANLPSSLTKPPASRCVCDHSEHPDA